MVVGRRELRSFGVLVGLEVPEPVLTGLVATDVAVVCLLEMPACVLRR
jgi:hypothetical protein